MYWSGGTLLILAVFINGCYGQFGEIASLATSLLGSALGGGGGLGALAGAGAAGAGAAGQAGGALAQIGQLYQLAQGALQLTGTGVGVLNQASEGNWFPAVLEQTAKSSQALMKSHGSNGLNLGALGPAPGKSGGGGIGPEFGTSFPAPDIDDYDENAEIPGFGKDKTAPKPPDGLIDIDSGDYEIATSAPSSKSGTDENGEITDSPRSEEETVEEETSTDPLPTAPPPRQIRIQLPDKNGNEKPEADLDYEDLIKGKTGSTAESKFPTIDAENMEELKKNLIATHGTKNQQIVPKLDKLVEVLQKSKLSKEEIREIVSQVEGNRNFEKPPKYDFNSAVQNIPDKKNKLRQKITEASRVINSNIDNQQKEQNVNFQKQVDELKVLPDLVKPSTPTSATASAIHPRSVNTAPQVPFNQGYNYGYTQQPQVQQQTQQYQYNQYYHTQAPFYGQQNQNYWGQHYNQQRPYVTNQAQVQQPYPQQQQQVYYNQYQQQPQVYSPQTVPQQYPRQQQLVQPQYQQPQNQQRIQQQYPQATPLARSTVSPVPTTANSNQVFHYYHDGRQIVQQIIPKQIATNGNLPLNGPFQSQNAAAVRTDPVEYQRRQRELSQAYLQPSTRGNQSGAGKVILAGRPVEQRSVSVQANVNPAAQPKIYESTVTANSHRQAHAIRTYQPTDGSKTGVQPPVKTSGRTSTVTKMTPKRISGHVLPGPTIDHRSLLEKRTTAKPRVVHMP